MIGPPIGTRILIGSRYFRHPKRLTQCTCQCAQAHVALCHQHISACHLAWYSVQIKLHWNVKGSTNTRALNNTETSINMLRQNTIFFALLASIRKERKTPTCSIVSLRILYNRIAYVKILTYFSNKNTYDSV